MVLCWLDTVTEGRGRPMNNILLINNVLSEASLFYALNSRYSCQKNLGFETAVSLTNGWFAEDDTCAGLTAAQIICQGACTSVQTEHYGMGARFCACTVPTTFTVLGTI